MNSLKRKFSGENLKWSEDRENYDQSQTRHENLQKRQSKLRAKYVQTTSKEDRKPKFSILKGLYLLYKAKFQKTKNADVLVFPLTFIP